MANLTADMASLQWSGLVEKTIPFTITNGLQLYIGSLVILTAGYAAKLVNGGLLVGVAITGGVPGSNPVLDGFSLLSTPIPSIAKGNTAAAAGNQPQVIVETGEFTWKRLTLTLANGTLAGTVADVGTKLYGGNSDNAADLTNTQPGADHPVGVITNFYSATATLATYDVLVNSYDARTRGN